MTGMKSLAEFASADAKNSNYFSGGVYVGKIPLSPPVCGASAFGGRSVRAADCELFAGKSNGLFGSAPLRETSAALFACTQFRPHCIQ